MSITAIGDGFKTHHLIKLRWIENQGGTTVVTC